VLEKAWSCVVCERAKQTVVEGAHDLVAVENISVDEVCRLISLEPGWLRDISLC
jgi:hypothetical protein